MEGKKRTPLLKRPGVQTLLASLLCIALGLVIGYIALLIIRPDGAVEGIGRIVKNFMYSTEQKLRIKNLGNTLTKTAPLLMCSLSVLFAYKVGLFNIGAAGQYVAGAGAALYCGLALKMPWYVCMVAALISGALLGMISGSLKAYFNVNEVISCIMLNWIILYCVNMLLTPLAPAGMPDTESLAKVNAAARLPSMGFEKLFPDNDGRVTIAIPLAVLIAVAVWLLLTKTKLGYELRATGANKHAARYAGMREKTNIILTMGISGALAGLGAAMYFLTDYQQWAVTQSAVPAMGFNGIAAAFLGGLNPIGAIFSSYFIEHITAGGTLLDNKVYSAETSELISAVIIYLCGFVLFFHGGMTKLVESFKQKSTRAKFTTSVVAVLLVLVVLFQTGAYYAGNARIDELVQGRLDDLRVAESQMDKVEKNQKDAEAAKEKLDKKLAELETKLAELETAKSKLAELQGILSETTETTVELPVEAPQGETAVDAEPEGGEAEPIPMNPDETQETSEALTAENLEAAIESSAEVVVEKHGSQYLPVIIGAVAAGLVVVLLAVAIATRKLSLADRSTRFVLVMILVIMLLALVSLLLYGLNADHQTEVEALTEAKQESAAVKDAANSFNATLRDEKRVFENEKKQAESQLKEVKAEIKMLEQQIAEMEAAQAQPADPTNESNEGGTVQ